MNVRKVRLVHIDSRRSALSARQFNARRGKFRFTAKQSADHRLLQRHEHRRICHLLAQLTNPEPSLGISRTLVYSYFPDGNSVLVAVLDRHAELSGASGLSNATLKADVAESMTSLSRMYLDHVIAYAAAIESCFVPNGQRDIFL